MEQIFITKTKTTPDVVYNTNNNILSFIGRCYPENSDSIFQKLDEWVMTFDEDKLIFRIQLEYFNTASSKHIYSIIKKLIDKNLKDFKVQWIYEIDDSDSLETGTFFQDGLDIKFEFIPIT